MIQDKVKRLETWPINEQESKQAYEESHERYVAAFQTSFSIVRDYVLTLVTEENSNEKFCWCYQFVVVMFLCQTSVSTPLILCITK